MSIKQSIAKHIEVDNQDLESWINDINEKLELIGINAVFSGISYGNSDVISIPKKAQEVSYPPNRPYMYKNGKIVDPSLLSFVGPCPTTIKLEGDAILNAEDTFIVFIQPYI
jgi:hypothetical protein